MCVGGYCCAGGEQQQQQSIREENDSLCWQLEGYKNNMELLRKEGGHWGHSAQQVQHNQEFQNLQQDLHSTQQVGIAGFRGQQETRNRRSKLPAFICVVAVAVKLKYFNKSFFYF